MLLVTFDRTSSPENPLHALFHPISLSPFFLSSLFAQITFRLSFSRAREQACGSRQPREPLPPPVLLPASVQQLTQTSGFLTHPGVRSPSSEGERERVNFRQSTRHAAALATLRRTQAVATLASCTRGAE